MSNSLTSVLGAEHEITTVVQGPLTFYYGFEQGTQQWLDFRSRYATCSNALLISEKGLNAAIECNRQHAARRTPNGNDYAERGHVLEDEIKEKLAEVFNNEHQKVINCSFITNEAYPLAGYSPDGIVVDAHTNEFIAPIEVKCFNDWTEVYDKKTGQLVKRTHTQKHTHCVEDIKNIPLDNIMQFEMEMLMTNTEQLLVVLYNPEADPGVPQLKIHVYKPFTMTVDGERRMVYREKLAKRLGRS